MARQRERRLVWLFILAALVLAAGLGMRDPSPPDEPRFAMMARDMVETGNWLVPHRGSEIYAEKPPVFMWLQASAYALVGHLRIAFLLPSLLAGLLTLWLVHDLAARLWSRQAGLAAAVALGLCLQFGLQAKRAQIDMVLVGMTTLAVWAMARHLLLGHSPRWLWFGAFMAGLGTVTKGVGFLPLLMLIPAAVLKRLGRLPLTDASTAPPVQQAPSFAGWWWIAPAFLAGTAVWLAPLVIELAAKAHPDLPAYTRELLFRQTGTRYFNAWHHVQPAWYYLEVMATLWLPGALALPWLLPAWWRRLRAGDPVLITLLSWAVMVLAFFTASPGKREVYIFPALPILCVAAAPVLADLLERSAFRWTLFVYGALLSAAMLGLGAAGLWSGAAWVERLAEARGISDGDLARLFGWFAAAGALGLVAMLVARPRRVVVGLVAMTATLWTAYGVGLTPALNASSSGSAVMQAVGEHLGPDAELGLVAWTEQLRLQADRPVRDFGFKAAAEAQWAAALPWLRADNARWVLAQRQTLPACIDAALVVDKGVANRRHWWLVPSWAAAGCMDAHAMPTP